MNPKPIVKPNATIIFTDRGKGIVSTTLVVQPDAELNPAIATALATFVAVPRLVEGIGIQPIAIMAPELREALRP